MRKTKLKYLKPREYFTLNPLEEPKESQVWVKGPYERITGKCSTHKFSEVNHEVLRTGEKEVYVDFTF